MQTTVGKHSIHYTQQGPKSGTTLILLHGFPFSSEMWKPQVQAFSEKYSTVTYDLVGHGKSSEGTGQYTIEEHVDQLFEFCKQLKIEKPVLLGFSMGGYIALRAVEKNESFFKALILCDTKSEADTNEGKLKRFQSVKDIQSKGVEAFAEGFIKNVVTSATLEKNKDLVQHVRSMITSTKPQSITGHLIALAARTDTTSALSKFRLPTMILVGEQDAVTTPAHAQSMQEKIPGSKLQMISNASHMINLENPKMFNNAILDFLKTIS